MTIDRAILAAAADAAICAVPPAWPLAATVAVNPYLGQSAMTLAQTSARLTRVAGVAATMPRAWYQDRIARGLITDADLAAALAASDTRTMPLSVEALKAATALVIPAPSALPTIAELSARVSGIDWPALVAERIGAWAAGYFDEGQALWAAPRDQGAYAAWRAAATHDLTPEIVGLAGFARFVADAPASADAAIADFAVALRLSPAALETCFHRLLTTLGGWAQLGRYRLWQAELGGDTDSTAAELLAVALTWEAALLHHYAADIDGAWDDVVAAHAIVPEPDAEVTVDAILQDASERAGRRALAQTLAADSDRQAAPPPVLQAAFCIDVRSEVFRRALESCDPRIATLGFAGFFGIATQHRRYASDVAEHRLPVLLNPSLTSVVTGEADEATVRTRVRATRAWGRFKLAAVSSFAFVEASGALSFGKLIADALGMAGHRGPTEPPPHFEPEPALDAKIAMATGTLRAMSLTRDFAPLVLIVGHGAQVANNAHASALHCGACGGYRGDVNARLLAGLLNDPHVREGVAAAGIAIPAATLFVAALHDTTTDDVMLYAADVDASSHAGDLARARQWFATAGTITRTERALRLAGGGASVAARARDWAQIRPEWGLAGCQAFIAAPRRVTRRHTLQGRAFLHDYDRHADTGDAVLEAIMTAPVVVASWISLQYYGSAVSPQLFGGGDKLLHNVVGGIGVVEGNGGVLRTGLPWQSVHDGTALVHEPVRLTVCIAALPEAMSAVLERHPGVRALFDNRWLHLLALDDDGRVASRYTGGLQWAAEPPASEGLADTGEEAAPRAVLRGTDADARPVADQIAAVERVNDVEA